MPALTAIEEAHAQWQGAREQEGAARALLLDAIRAARAKGMTLEAIAAELGTSRQYVHKLLKG